MQTVIVVAMIALVIMGIGIVSANNLSEVTWNGVTPATLGSLSAGVNISPQNNAIARAMVSGYIHMNRDNVSVFKKGNIDQLVFFENGKMYSLYNLSVDDTSSGMATGMYAAELVAKNMDTNLTIDKIYIFIFYNADGQPLAVGWGSSIDAVTIFVPGSDNGSGGGSSSGGGNNSGGGPGPDPSP
jgi:hypothetical protein